MECILCEKDHDPYETCEGFKYEGCPYCGVPFKPSKILLHKISCLDGKITMMEIELNGLIKQLLESENEVVTN